MINFFRKLNPISILILIIIALLLRLGIFLQLPETLEFTFLENYGSALFSISSTNLFNPASNVFFALVITIIQAIIFNRMVNAYNLLSRPSFLPALMYVTASSMLLPFLVLSPALICNFLMLWLIWRFLSIYRSVEARSVMFDSGMIIGFGTLIYFPFIVMIPLLWVALTIFRPFDWREWISGIIGFITIYFFLGVGYYLLGSFDKFYQLEVPLAATFPGLFNIKLYDYIVLAPLAVILILSCISLQSKLKRSSVHVRKAYLIMLIVAVFAVLSFYIKPEYHVYHFMLAVPPIAVFMSHYFMNATKAWFFESLYVVLLGSIVYFQFV
ncbi:DUF6427 family protein [Desertivirga xinjiangensis]|uniref:DUF6427 family protein n=1 Tax=Desertivirga xinjiangensis TaxID=539206 RepID=UPI00210B2457|nr:DUF6427 family protein [Pedobacter xinjiangensis]